MRWILAGVEDSSTDWER
jgi:hypothetical protein